MARVSLGSESSGTGEKLRVLRLWGYGHNQMRNPHRRRIATAPLGRQRVQVAYRSPIDFERRAA